MRGIKNNEREYPHYLSASKIQQQLKELQVISQNQSLVEKVTRPVTHTLVSFINPYASYYHNAIGLKSFLAENLLRHYYNGHESLGTGTTDAVVAKMSRAAHLRSRNNAGPAQRAIAAYEKYVAETPGAMPALNHLDDYQAYDTAHGVTLPAKLLAFLKAELLAKGEALNLKGTLAALIYVIQTKCEMTVIDLQTINAEIAATKKDKVGEAPASKSQSSFWSRVNPMGYLSKSNSKEASSSTDDVLFGDAGLDVDLESSL